MQINKECKELYQQKMIIQNELLKQMNLTNKKFVLIDDENEISKEFNNLWIYAQTLFDYLWDDHYTIYKIISNANLDYLKHVKHNLAQLFVHNFYNNILSSNYVEDNLFYIITLLINEEIGNITNINYSDNCLNGIKYGIFLEKLCNKIDIKSYCKLNILNVIENLESNFSSKTNDIWFKENFRIISIK